MTANWVEGKIGREGGEETEESFSIFERREG
jgi:hypothetical protein